MKVGTVVTCCFITTLLSVVDCYDGTVVSDGVKENIKNDAVGDTLVDSSERELRGRSYWYGWHHKTPAPSTAPSQEPTLAPSVSAQPSLSISPSSSPSVSVQPSSSSAPSSSPTDPPPPFRYEKWRQIYTINQDTGERLCWTIDNRRYVYAAPCGTDKWFYWRYENGKMYNKYYGMSKALTFYKSGSWWLYLSSHYVRTFNYVGLGGYFVTTFNNDYCIDLHRSQSNYLHINWCSEGNLDQQHEVEGGWWWKYFYH